MKVQRPILAALSLVAVFSIGIPCWAQKGKPQPPPDPAIVYVAERGWSQTDLMVMNADGTNQKVILAGGRDFGNHDPDWSPDGSRIVFGSNVLGYGIYLINKDGTGLCRVVQTYNMPAWGDGAPKWSPDGTKILYSDSPGLGQQSDLFLAEATCNATPPTNLTNSPARSEYHPTWAPDGLRFAAKVYGTSETADILVFEMTQGAAAINLTTTGPLAAVDVTSPEWARLSDKIAVAAPTSSVDQFDIWVLELNAPTGPTNITKTLGIKDWQPSWSPSDSQIVYERDGSIYVMNADGSTPRTIATPGKRMVTLRAPDWRPTP